MLYQFQVDNSHLTSVYLQSDHDKFINLSSLYKDISLTSIAYAVHYIPLTLLYFLTDFYSLLFHFYYFTQIIFGHLFLIFLKQKLEILVFKKQWYSIYFLFLNICIYVYKFPCKFFFSFIPQVLISASFSIFLVLIPKELEVF